MRRGWPPTSNTPFHTSLLGASGDRSANAGDDAGDDSETDAGACADAGDAASAAPGTDAEEGATEDADAAESSDGKDESDSCAKAADEATKHPARRIERERKRGIMRRDVFTNIKRI